MASADIGLLRIGEVSQRAGVSDQAIRYYERLGLLRPTRRAEGGARLYAESAVTRLAAIKQAQALGFTLTDIGALLSPERKEDSRCLQAQVRLERRAQALEEELALAAQRRDEVARLRQVCESCTGACRLEAEMEPHFP